MENRVSKLEGEMDDIKIRMAVAESSIKDIREDIHTIKDDTKWLRRAISNAIIVAIVGGVIAITFAALKGGA